MIPLALVFVSRSQRCGVILGFMTYLGELLGVSFAFTAGDIDDLGLLSMGFITFSGRDGYFWISYYRPRLEIYYRVYASTQVGRYDLPTT